MDERIIKTIKLENKLVLNLYDESVKMIGDRWLVTLVARIRIPVNAALIQEDSSALPDEDKLKRMFGQHIVFEQKINRIFVDKNEKETVLSELCENFLDNTLSYLSHAKFPKRFLIKKLKEEKAKQLYQR